MLKFSGDQALLFFMETRYLSPCLPEVYFDLYTDSRHNSLYSTLYLDST